MSATTPRCVVFDIDDTLYLERDYVRSGFRAAGAWAREHLGVDGFAERAWALFDRGRRGRIFDEVLDRCGIEASARKIEALVEVYRRHRPDVKLLPDASACMGDLRGGVALGCVTDGPVESQRAKASALGLANWLRPILLTAELGEGFGKPDPRPFRLVEDASGAAGEQCVYVADNPAKDFAGPKGLGWRTVRLKRKGGLHYDVGSGPDVDVALPDLSGLARALGLEG